MPSSQGATVGRPRAFDLDRALDIALLQFWKNGYEGTSLADLTAAMGISKPSLYAAFGGKSELFAKVLQRYVDGPGSYATRALEQPTARRVVEAMLRGAVETTTSPDGFGGCLTIQGAIASSEGAHPAFDLLVAWRRHAGALLEERLVRASDEGDLPPGADPAQLARFIMTVLFGIAVQAADSVSKEELDQVASAALVNWPTAE